MSPSRSNERADVPGVGIPTLIESATLEGGTMHHRRFLVLSLLLVVPPCLCGQVVKITPLGLKTGEFCFVDRAMIFEDPTGIRILYDPGFTVAGSGGDRAATAPIVVPLPAACFSPLNFGARRTVQHEGSTSGVQISVVMAKHDNLLGTNLVSDPLATQLASQGLELAALGDPV